MGAGFVLLMLLVAMLVASAAIAVVAVVITALVSDKKRRNRKVFLAAASPFVFSLTLFFTGLVSSIAVSEITGVDLGIGDTWYLPLNDRCHIVMIDTTDSGYIESDDGQSISVTEIQQTGHKVYGLTDGKRYFSLNLNDQKLVQYDLEKDFFEYEQLENKDVNLEPLGDFYQRRSAELAGNWMWLARVLSVLISVLVVYGFCRLVLYGGRSGFKRDSARI